MDRKERLKAELFEDPFLEQQFEEEKIDARPSKMKVFGRRVMDSLGVKSAKSEIMRDREVMGEVLVEYRREKEQRRLEALRRRERERQETQERRLLEEAAREEALERGRLEHDMGEAREHFERHKQEKFESQRVQELLERELNSRLTTVEGLSEAVMAEEEGVSKRVVEFEGEEIPVYDLSGKPFEMISHAVDYRYANWSLGSTDIGNKTAQELLEHPEIWERSREEVMMEAGYGTRREDAKGDVISCSYVNSERNMDTRVSKYGTYYSLCYGFEKLPADSLLYMTKGDGGTSNTGGKGETLLGRSDTEAIKRLEGAGGTSMYNEMVLRRYDEAGEPLLPSYIIAEDGHITETAMRHAKYFGVPIVNIERKAYEKRLEKKALEAIDGVDEESSYDEVAQAIEVLRRAPRYYDEFHEISSVGRMRDSVAHEREREFAAPGTSKEKICRLEELEFEKRLDLIEGALRAGRGKGRSAPAGFEYFSALEFPVRGTMYDVPSGCDRLLVTFRRKGSTKAVETTIYDGGNVVQGEEAVRLGYMTEEELRAGDSSVYQRFAPLVRAYR